jgi:ATP-dependent RNA helicase RhlE
VPEDYVHRIGRTGRAGNEGAAVSFVCLDEEGFMQEIERFTKQRIPTQVIEGFGAEPGERGEPIAMGRQTIWGGAGKPPSREVMMAAAKAARQEMMTRIRDNKASDGARGGERSAKPKQPQGQRSANSNGNGNGNGNGARNGNGTRNGGAPRQGGARPPQQSRPAHGHTPRHADDAQPRDGAHNSASPFVQRDAPVRHTDGQPDPLRTSVDSMGGRGRRGGGGGGRSGRGGGGGFGPRGPGNPTRSFGR